MTVFPRLYAITDESAPEPQIEQVRALVEAGAGIVQVRDKKASGRDLYECVASALEITRPRGVLLMVNDRVDVALAAGADGVHVGQEDLPADAAREILGNSAIIGVSTHSVEQAAAASKLPVDYVAFGPVFQTTTKANPDPVVGIAGLQEVRLVVAMPLVAIGGITLENAESVFAAGADSVAVVRDLRKGPSVAERIKAYNALWPSRS